MGIVMLRRLYGCMNMRHDDYHNDFDGDSFFNLNGKLSTLISPLY